MRISPKATTGLGCLATFVYFALFAMVLVGVALGNNCGMGACLSDGAWAGRIVAVFVGGFAIFFGGVYAVSRFWSRFGQGDDL